MVNNRSNVIMITEEDIEQLLIEWKNVPAWIKAHVSARRPAHRYEGELLLGDESLVFNGRDIKEGKAFEVEIPFDRIKDVYHGFSENLKTSIDPAFGMGGPEPFAIRYHDNGKGQTVYFNTNSDSYPAHRNINNLRWCETLYAIVARYRRLKLEGMRHRVLVSV